MIKVGKAKRLAWKIQVIAKPIINYFRSINKTTFCLQSYSTDLKEKLGLPFTMRKGVSVPLSFFIPPFFKNMQPPPPPLDIHRGKIPDSMMKMGIRETENN